MEILKETADELKFTVPDDLGSATFTVFRGITQIGGTYNATLDSGIATCPLPYASTFSAGKLKVVLRFNYQSNLYEPEKFVEVVSPYLEMYEIQEMGVSQTDAQKVEAAARHIINANTGQTFSYYPNETVRVEGHGEDALRLPRRLIRVSGLETETAVLNPQSAIIVSDGWYLKKGWSEETTAKDYDGTYWGAADVDSSVLPGEPGYEKPGHGPVIYAPGVGPRPTPWRDDYPFTVTGDWGYEFVPSPVREAAKLLANDYACMEIMYRDRYLNAITAADWRLDFNSRAYESTGNVRADQLLSEYVLLDWAVV